MKKDKPVEDVMNDEKAMPEPTTETPVVDFGSETFELSSERAAMFTATRPQGSAAKGYTEKVMKSLDKSKDEIRKKYFGSDKKLADQWEADYLTFRNKKVGDAYQYEVAQVIHGAKVDNDLELAKSFSEIVDGFDMANAAAFNLTGASLEQSSIEYTAQTKNQADMESDNPIADPESEEGKIEATSRAKFKVDVAAKRSDDISTANIFYNGKINLARENTSKFIAARHKEQYFHAKNVLGLSHEASVAFANTQIQKNTKKIMQDLVKTNPECAKVVLAWLARPNATKVSAVDKDGKEIIGENGEKVLDQTKWNPLGRWCLTQGDVSELIMSAEQQLRAYSQMQKLKATEDLTWNKIYQERLQMNVDRWKGDVVLKIANGDLVLGDSVQSTLQSIIPEIRKFQAQGYEKTDVLLGEITSAINRHFKMREDTVKMVKEANQTQRKNLLSRRYNELKHATVDNVSMLFTTPDGKLYKADNVERRAALIATIDAMLMDEATSDATKAQLRAEREQLKSERDKRNAKALELLAKRVGWKLPVAQDKAFISYKNQEVGIIEGMPSYQTGDDLLFTDKGVAHMGSTMKAVWIDPDNPNSTLSLGKNEINGIFSHILSQLQETPEDDLAAIEGGKGPTRVEQIFLNAMRGAKRASDSQTAYSAIASAIRTGDKALFENPTSTRRMSFLKSNYVIPPLPIKKVGVEDKDKK